MRGRFVLNILQGFSLVVLLFACNAKSFPCDIRDSTCQNDVWQLTVQERNRGASALPPEINVLTEAGYLALFDGSDETEEEQESNTFDPRIAQGLAFFDLLPADWNTEQNISNFVTRTAAVYDSVEKAVYVVDRGRDFSSEASVTLLAHEYVHALQDAEVEGLHLWRRQFFGEEEGVGNTNLSLALNALTEGEATFVASLTYLAGLGFNPAQDIDSALLIDFYNQIESATRSEIISSSALLANVGRLVYPAGAIYLAMIWLSEGRSMGHDLYHSPPLSTREVFQRSQGVLDPITGIPDDPQTRIEVAGYTVIDDDRYGSWVVDFMLKRLGVEDISSHKVNSDLRGDRCVVYAAEQGADVVVVWTFRWDDSFSAKEFGEALKELSARPFSVLFNGKDISVVAAEQESVRELFLAGLR